MLLRLVAAYAAGLGLRRAPSLPVAAAAALVLFAASARGGARPRLAWGWLPALLLAAALGVLEPRRLPNEAKPDGEVRVVGWIASRPEQRQRGAAAELVVESVRQGGTGLRRGQRLRIVAATRLPVYGSRCAAEGVLRAPRGRRNFTGFDERSLMRARGDVAVLEAARVAVLHGSRGPAWRREVIEPLRTLLTRRLEQSLAAAPAGIMAALLLGLDADIPPDLAESWRALGMTHVLVISGMHVSLVAAALLACAGSPRRPGGLLVLVVGVSLYAALGGLGPSVLRATVMVVWSAVALYLGRTLAPLTSLGLAAGALVLGAPQIRYDLGFQLSCLCTAGILLWAPPLHALSIRLRQRRFGMLWAFLLGGAGIGAAAQLATLPLVAARFGYVVPAGIITSITIVPLSNVALVLGLAGVPLALVSESLSRPLWLLAGGLIHGVNQLVTAWVQSDEPRGFVPSSPLCIAFATVASGALLLAGTAAGARRHRTAVACIVVGVVTGVGFAVLASRPSSPTWRLEALDVGQGDALLLILGRDAWLVDCGDARPFDQGRQTVLPELRRLGIDKLRGVVLTHPHRDHYGGAASLLRAVAVETLYVAAASRHAQAYRDLQATGVPLRTLQAGERLALSRRHESLVLWPRAADSLGSGANAQSLVLWLRGGGLPQLLAMGDLEAEQEDSLRSLWADSLAAAAPEFLVLKVGHHGSRTSSSPDFLDVIDAEVALVSVGARNRFGHPAANTLEALERRGCVVLRTDQGGAVGLELRGSALWLERPDSAPSLLRAAPESPAAR